MLGAEYRCSRVSNVDILCQNESHENTLIAILGTVVILNFQFEIKSGNN